MKFAILSVFLFGLAFANADSSSEESIKDLADMLQKKFNLTIVQDVVKMIDQAKTKCPDVEHKVEDVAEKVSKCIEDIDLGSETFCSLIKKNFVKCTKPAKELIVSCLPDESKDLPGMAEKMILAIIGEACHSTVEEMLELLNPCELEKDFESFPPCNEIKTVLEEHKNKLPSKSLVCSMIPKVKNCAKAHVDASCKNPITKKALVKFQEVVENAIKDDCDALNKA